MSGLHGERLVMVNLKQEHQLLPDSKSLYFDLQADFGITKHMGGRRATRELAKLCHVHQDSYVLEVGCGIGSTSCLLASEYGCQVLAVDLSERMVAHAAERVKKRGIHTCVECKVADAQQLPFEEAQFDAVIDESVTAFVVDKKNAISEYIRVSKQGGYIGLNEVAWIKTPPPDLAQYITLIMAGADFLTSEGWTALLESSGLKELQVSTHKFDARRQWLDEMQQLNWKESFRAWFRFITQSVTNPAYRKFTQEVLRVPRNIFKFMDYISYGLYVGRK
jgi:ubiquinone/menaquinone biosynthesis C-methylase UbiE